MSSDIGAWVPTRRVFEPGDRVAVRFTNTRLPLSWATVERVEADALHVKYDDDAENFAGLRGLVRLDARDRR